MCAERLASGVRSAATWVSGGRKWCACLSVPTWCVAKLYWTNPIERFNGEIKRRAEVVGMCPNDDAIVRLVGSILLEQNDEWAVQRARYMTLETIAPLLADPHFPLPPGAD